jgi:hypothetical protein
VGTEEGEDDKGGGAQRVVSFPNMPFRRELVRVYATGQLELTLLSGQKPLHRGIFERTAPSEFRITGRQMLNGQEPAENRE